jgi:hypothetical protein
MNTKLVMTFTALVLGVTGIFLTFAPDLALSLLLIDIAPITMLLAQVLGGLYFSYAMLNWMTKESLIGGIYNRPVAVANLTHFIVAGLVLVKGLLAHPELPKALWIAGGIYAVLGILFTIILFRHPVKSSD